MYKVNYFPAILSEKQMKKIRDNISPSMYSDESCLYQVDSILEEFKDKEIIEACKDCDYIEL